MAGLNNKIKHIGVVSRLSDPSIVTIIDNIVAVTNRLNLQCTLDVASTELADAKLAQDVDVAKFKQCDLIIVIGGDGNLLYFATRLLDINVPILGINKGRLGFLTDIKPDNLSHYLTEILLGNYLVDERFLLDVSIISDAGRRKQTSRVLNDAVLHGGGQLKLIEYDLYVDDVFVYHQRADGLIISTPTGSTAYSLSAGGSILDSKINAINIVPICPHNLSSRPIIIDANSKISVIPSFNNSTHIEPIVSLDGENQLRLSKGDEVRVTKSNNLLRFIHVLDYDYYSICRSKLGWGRQLVN